jgi:hypothetical protein
LSFETRGKAKLKVEPFLSGLFSARIIPGFQPALSLVFSPHYPSMGFNNTFG